MSSQQQNIWPMLAASGAVAATALTVYWATKKTYQTYVPYEYHYRPGTISGWLSRMLAKYSHQRRKQRPVRVYMDGCFDMMHYGHANALRQAKALGDELVVGLIPDSEILRCKGPPVLNEEERFTLVDSIKWVDEVITGVPYDLSPEFIDELFQKHRIDYIIHGDDPCLLPDGTDAYAHAKRLGRFRMIKRTEGVSTTDIVGRMLTCTRTNRQVAPANSAQREDLTRHFSRGHEHPSDDDDDNTAAGRRPQRTALSRFLPTSRRLVQFSNGRVPPEDAAIVYIDGAFDVFHPGHVQILQAAKAVGSFLLVGLHTDEDVEARRGAHLPIMSLHERALSVLACKYVDEVILGAPMEISQDLIKTFNISLVVRGSRSETSHLGPPEPFRYRHAQEAGIFEVLPSPSGMTTSSIISRIVANRQKYEERNAKKAKSEEAYYTAAKTYVSEI